MIIIIMTFQAPDSILFQDYFFFLQQYHINPGIDWFLVCINNDNYIIINYNY